MSLAIANLHVNAVNFVITGILMHKTNVKTFTKKGNTQISGVIKFVVRDSALHFINLTTWGTAEFVDAYSKQFHLKNVIDVIKAKVSPVQSTDAFSPITTSTFQLTINEGYGSIELHQNENQTEYLKLFNVPLKPPDHSLTLADIASSRSASESENNLADLLVIVAKVKPIRKINDNLMVREVVVVDQTCPGVCFSIWNEAWIERSNSWEEMSTILHLVNVRFKYSEFHKSIVLVTNYRTLIVENPITQYSETLQRHVRTAVFNSFVFDFSVDLAGITSVMTVQQIMDQIDDIATDDIYCITYAIVTQLDLDGCSQYYSRRCSHCQRPMRIKSINCDNENCSILYAENPLVIHYIDYFNIPVHLTDHTGTLEECRLRGDFAERILGYNLTSFLNLSDTSRGLIKWKYLLERCCVKLSIRRKTALRSNMLVSIVDCKVANMTEVVEKIKPY